MNNYPVFYHPKMEEPFLSKEESFHAIRVLRLTIGAPLFLINGIGEKWEAKIGEITKNTVKIHLVSKKEIHQNKPKLHLIIAPTKQMDRMEWMVEKCTEIGVASFQFIQTFHSERKDIKLERLEKIAISAIKQSKQLYLPELKSIERLEDYLNKKLNTDRISLFGSLNPDKNKIYKDIDFLNKEIQFMVGPEGDFSENEITKLLEKNWLPISLGKTILRTETAAIVAACQFSGI